MDNTIRLHSGTDHHLAGLGQMGKLSFKNNSAAEVLTPLATIKWHSGDDQATAVPER